jgi:hypothetical protein
MNAGQFAFFTDQACTNRLLSLVPSLDLDNKPITGMDIIDAAGVPINTSITISASGNTLTATDGTTTGTTEATANGFYALPLGSGYIVVEVTNHTELGLELTDTGASAAYTFSINKHALFDAISSQEATTGGEDIRVVYFKNLGTQDVTALRFFAQAPQSGETIQLSLDGATWQNAISLATAINAGNFAAGASVALHVRRKVEQQITQAVLNNSFNLRWYLDDGGV